MSDHGRGTQLHRVSIVTEEKRIKIKAVFTYSGGDI